MPKGTYGIPAFCVVCTKDIPTDRLAKGSITCSKPCYDARRKAQRAQQDAKECRYCRNPSTPEDREAFRRFRKLEEKRPDLIFPEAYEAFKADAGEQPATPETFAAHWAAKRGKG